MIGALVQARMGSKRLPGKVLAPLAGKPALDYVVERLAAAGESGLAAICTSEDEGDDPVAEFCELRGLRCVRGALDDVAARLLAAATELELDAFVRVNGDSPLIDPQLVDRGVALFAGAETDLVSNVFPARSYPRGQSVEVLRTAAVERAWAKMDSAEEREHVTPYLYAHPDEFAIEGFASGGDFGDVRLVLDTDEDRLRLEGVLAAMDRAHTEYGWREIVELAG